MGNDIIKIQFNSLTDLTPEREAEIKARLDAIDNFQERFPTGFYGHYVVRDGFLDGLYAKVVFEQAHRQPNGMADVGWYQCWVQLPEVLIAIGKEVADTVDCIDDGATFYGEMPQIGHGHYISWNYARWLGEKKLLRASWLWTQCAYVVMQLKKMAWEQGRK